MAKLIVEKVNTDSREVLGKTCDSSTYSGDTGSREKIKGQTYITTEDVDDNMTVRGDGEDNLIRKVPFPIHHHSKNHLGWSNAQVLMRFVLLQLVVMPILLILLIKVR